MNSKHVSSYQLGPALESFSTFKFILNNAITSKWIPLYTDSGDNALRPFCLSKTSSVSFDAHISLILKESSTFYSFGDLKLENT